MNDTIRWCWTCNRPERDLNRDGRWYPLDCNTLEHDTADALVIRADQPVYRIDESKFSPLTEGMLDGMKKRGVLVRLGEEEQ